MTKPELLKWLDGKCADALRKVKEQEQSAKSALLQQKIEQSKFDDFAAYVIPRMQEIYDRLNAWHSENENLVGPVYYTIVLFPVRSVTSYPGVIQRWNVCENLKSARLSLTRIWKSVSTVFTVRLREHIALCV